MKTSGNFTTAIFALSAAFVFTLTSCQKDELITPNALATQPVDQAANINPAANKFQLLSIQHTGVDRKYHTLQIFSNGELIATEYQNGSLNRSKHLILSADMNEKIKATIRQFNFSAPPPQDINRNLPTMSITFCDNPSAKSLHRTDYEHGDTDLNKLIRDLEDMTNTTEFFAGRDTKEPLPVIHN